MVDRCELCNYVPLVHIFQVIDLKKARKYILCYDCTVAMMASGKCVARPVLVIQKTEEK